MIMVDVFKYIRSGIIVLSVRQRSGRASRMIAPSNKDNDMRSMNNPTEGRKSGGE